MLQVGRSVLCKFSSSLKVECAVFPPDRSVAAIPDEATAIAMSPCSRIFARSKLRRNVFPVPPGASRKTMLPVSSRASCRIAS